MKRVWLCWYRLPFFIFILVFAVFVARTPPTTWVLGWKLWLQPNRPKGRVQTTLAQAREQMESLPFSWWIIAPAMDSTNDAVRLEVSAIRNLMQPDDKRASEMLFTIAEAEQIDSHVRAHSLALLRMSKCSDEKVLSILERLLISDPDPFIRACAFDELFHISLNNSGSPYQQARKVIIRALEECEYSGTISRAIRILSSYPGSWYQNKATDSSTMYEER